MMRNPRLGKREPSISKRKLFVAFMAVVISFTLMLLLSGCTEEITTRQDCLDIGMDYSPYPYINKEDGECVEFPPTYYTQEEVDALLEKQGEAILTLQREQEIQEIMIAIIIWETDPNYDAADYRYQAEEIWEQQQEIDNN